MLSGGRGKGEEEGERGGGNTKLQQADPLRADVAVILLGDAGNGEAEGGRLGQPADDDGGDQAIHCQHAASREGLTARGRGKLQTDPQAGEGGGRGGLYGVQSWEW